MQAKRLFSRAFLNHQGACFFQEYSSGEDLSNAEVVDGNKILQKPHVKAKAAVGSQAT